jgi:hypothetical protein
VSETTHCNGKGDVSVRTFHLLAAEVEQPLARAIG